MTSIGDMAAGAVRRAARGGQARNRQAPDQESGHGAEADVDGLAGKRPAHTRSQTGIVAEGSVLRQPRRHAIGLNV